MGMFLMKFATWLLSPLAIGLFLILAGFILLWRDRRRIACTAFLLSFVWLWIWSSPWFYILIGTPLENLYPPRDVHALPKADVIIVLGGGAGAAVPPHTLQPELFSAADRGWQAARCYKAGKAPYVLFSGVSEAPGMKAFLEDLGVPAKAIILEGASRNTYENAAFTKKKLAELKAKRVILVTSAWHMRRSVAVFKRFDVEVIPFGADYEARFAKGVRTPSKLSYWLPTPEILLNNSYILKEYIGAVAYAIYGK